MTDTRSMPSAEQIDRWRQRIRTSTHAHYHRAMAKALLAQSSPAAALTHARQGVQQEPQDAEAWHLLITASEQTGTPGLDALQSEASAAVADFATARLALRAIEIMTAGDIEQAARTIDEAGMPASPAAEWVAKAILALALARRARGESPIPDLEKGYRLKPDAPDICRELGSALLTARRLPEALEVLRHGFSVAPEDEQIRHFLGLTLLTMQRFEEMIDIFSIEPVSMPGRLRIGWAHQVQGRYALALSCYDTLASTQGGFRQLGLAYRSLCLLSQGLPADEPLALLAQEANPHYEATTCRAVALAVSGQAEAALSLLAPIITQTPFCSVHVAHSLVLTILGRETEAAQALEAARKASMPSIPLYVRLYPQASRFLGPLCARLGIPLPADETLSRLA